MKKIISVLAISAILFSCSKVKDGEFLISGTAKGFENGKKVVLHAQDEASLMMKPLDTVLVKDGKFEFTGKIKEPAMYSISFPEMNNGFSLIVENDEIEVEVYKDSIQFSKMGGTYHNDEYFRFNQEMKNIGKSLDKKLKDYEAKNTNAYNAAVAANDTAKVKSLVDGVEKIKEGYAVAVNKYAKENPKSFISALIIENMFRQPNSNMEDIKKLYENLDDDLKNYKVGKNIKKQLDAINGAKNKTETKNVSLGSVAPDFSASSPDGKVISLKQSLGKVTIIDFWASWCGPCRKENPSVVALYNEFHSKGLNIIGVSLDKNAEEWKAAIAKDKLTWNQVSNLKFWDEPIAKQYGVEQIPTTYLLDNEGRIIAKDLRGEELKAKVISLLAI